MSQKSRATEQPAVKTTIVGGRPPGPGKTVGAIPRGIEVLVKKASVDADFRRLLLEKRAGAAREIELTLEPAEAMMLDAVPAAHLEAIIASTTVAPVTRAAFLGKAAAAMLAALAAGGCDEVPAPTRGVQPDPPTTKGIRSDRPPKADTAVATPPPAPSPGDAPPAATGIRPDPPPAKPKTATSPAGEAPAEPAAPAMPMAGAVRQPIPRVRTETAVPTQGIRPDKP
ncbi:MAG TPA: hypothetical protein PLE19_16720 [Planctomycetota bacterium]|nr:hypothetical protein [Planctomycetota bacterium]HRR79904.1 hypothetical protein [Planctomycetota bacterium]HRT95132.1 hypothetical protein [Planctomycetota bacterium]